MNTLRLWRKLRNPPLQHPIFRYNIKKSGSLYAAHWMKLVIALGAVYIALRFNILGLVLYGLVLGLLLPALFIITSGTLLGLRTAIDTSNQIGQMQENGAAELYTLSPQGTVGWRWLVGMGCLHRQQQFRALSDMIKLIVALGLFAALGAIIVTGRDVLLPHFGGMFFEHDLRGFFILMAALPLLIGLYIDHIQSIVLGVLMGINIPAFTQNRVEAHTLATILFIFLQGATYVCVGLTYAVVVPAVYQALLIDSVFAEFMRVVLSIVAMILIREGLILFLWQAARHSAEQPYSIDMLPGTMAHNRS